MSRNQKRVIGLISVIMTVALLTSCGAGGQSQGADYKETKTMVLDILKSDDGKKAIQKAQGGGSSGGGDEGGGEGGEGSGGGGGGGSQMKSLSVGDQQMLQTAVKDVLTAEGTTQIIQNLMKDPKFAGDFAKTIKKENKQLLKDLMKDPEYQKDLAVVMKNPEYEKMLMDTMKSTQYRQQMMTVIQESLQSPLFKAQLIQLMSKALEEQMKPGKESPSAQGEKGGQGGQGGQGEEGGGQGEDSGGGDKKKEEGS